jgi:CheY-like chemotaxis protein
MSMAWLLREYGHEVRVVRDGPAAFQEVQAGMPDVIFLDIGLPGDSVVYEVAQRLQEYNGEKKPLLVAITRCGSEVDRRHSSEVGIDLHLIKPVEKHDLLRFLNRFQRIVER